MLSFVKGRLVGLPLSGGYDDAGGLVVISWASTLCDPWAQPLTWFDDALARELGNLIASYFAKTHDPFWRLVLMRAVRMVVDANLSSPLDTAIPTAAAALEMLGWVIESEGLVKQLAVHVEAAPRIRQRLTWAGIPTAIPPELPLLATRAK